MGTCRIHFNKALDDGGQADGQVFSLGSGESCFLFFDYTLPEHFVLKSFKTKWGG